MFWKKGLTAVKNLVSFYLLAISTGQNDIGKVNIVSKISKSWNSDVFEIVPFEEKFSDIIDSYFPLCKDWFVKFIKNTTDASNVV